MSTKLISSLNPNISNKINKETHKTSLKIKEVNKIFKKANTKTVTVIKILILNLMELLKVRVF